MIRSLFVGRARKITSSARRLNVLGLTVLGGIALAATAHAKLTSVGHSEVSFTAVGPAGLKIVGTTTELQMVDDSEKLTISVPLAHLTTGIGLRDKHMRETYLETHKYPNALLEAPRSALKFPAGDAELQGDAQGVVTIHGQAKPTNFHYTARRAGNGFKVAGTMRVNMNDFGIRTPKYMGVTVKPETDISVRFDIDDR